MNKIAFISGHLDLTDEEFKVHYKPLIYKAIEDGHEFVVGDARGCDAMSQLYLDSQKFRSDRPVFVHVTVYHMFDTPRNNIGSFETLGGYDSDTERDEAMTDNSDYDIAWVRPGREKSGTAKNIIRRNAN